VGPAWALASGRTKSSIALARVVVAMVMVVLPHGGVGLSLCAELNTLSQLLTAIRLRL
jgi:hypothetical protein